MHDRNPTYAYPLGIKPAIWRKLTPSPELCAMLRLKGRGYSFSDSAALVISQPDVGYVLGFIINYSLQILEPHAWIFRDGEHMDPTNDATELTRIALYVWTHSEFKALSKAEIAAQGFFIPPRITPEGVIEFTEAKLGEVIYDTVAASQLYEAITQNHKRMR